MAVMIHAVEPGSPACRAGLCAGETLVALNGEPVVDVLDYRFHQQSARLTVEVIGLSGRTRRVRIRKAEDEELGLLFETYLMDGKHSCKNKCVFCFIDQLPKGLRETLYFKDDDSRLSFLFGNYITLTNLTEHEITRIIKWHISPVNISVHTTDPDLRVRMMKNPHAGETLEVLDRFNVAGIRMNCQLVLCPGWNDGAALERTLRELTALEQVGCIAAVPVGLTRCRAELTPLTPFDEVSAAKVLDIIDRFGEECIRRYGERRVYGADEFYLLCGREIPDADYYGDFLQLENGVGLWALLRQEANDALRQCGAVLNAPRRVTVATGMAAYPLLSAVARMCEDKIPGLSCTVRAIRNDFFGERITVAGLVTGNDLYEQLKDSDLGDELLIPAVMLRNEGDLFLDGMSVTKLSSRLNIPVIPVDNDGWQLVDAIIGRTEGEIIDA